MSNVIFKRASILIFNFLWFSFISQNLEYTYKYRYYYKDAVSKQTCKNNTYQFIITIYTVTVTYQIEQYNKVLIR